MTKCGDPGENPLPLVGVGNDGRQPGVVASELAMRAGGPASARRWREPLLGLIRFGFFMAIQVAVFSTWSVLGFVTKSLEMQGNSGVRRLGLAMTAIRQIKRTWSHLSKSAKSAMIFYFATGPNFG